MVIARTWFFLFMVVATLAATAGCATDQGSGGVIGGGGGVVGGGGGVVGGDSGRGGGGVGSAGADAGAAGARPTGSDLGIPCTSDAECETGMVCLSASSKEFNGGGPANGMCTLPCRETLDCSAVSAGADCVNLGTETAPRLYCLGGCSQGGDASTAANKCQGRADFACVDLSDTAAIKTFCVPLCRSDLDCGSGLFCDKRGGFCAKTKPPVGDPIGTVCTPASVTKGVRSPGSENCEGFCFQSPESTTPGKGVCVDFCAGLLDCRYTGLQPGGVCLGALSDTFGFLDLGYCLPSCGCTADCPLSGDRCSTLTDQQQSLVEDLGAQGLCTSDLSDSVELTSCQDDAGGSSGASGSSGDEPTAAGTSGASD